MRPEIAVDMAGEQRQHVWCSNCMERCRPTLTEFLVVVRWWGRWLCHRCRPWEEE